MTRMKILIAHNDLTISLRLKEILQNSGYFCIILKENSSIDTIETHSPINLILVGDKVSDDMTGIEYVRNLRKWNESIPIVYLTEFSSESLAIEALRAGVSDYVKYPSDVHEICNSVRKLSKIRVCNNAEIQESDLVLDDKIIGNSTSIKTLKNYLKRIALSESNVLITGETGTGKELVAEMVHAFSKRGKKNLVSINCAAIPDNLLENELFGHERGAFTGADTSRDGMINTNGTIFLDEIGDMSLNAQAKILRVLETRKIQRLGGSQDISVNIRLIAATNKNLEDMTKSGHFRKDLYFRLNVARLQILPLRERKTDIPVLVDHFIKQFNKTFEKSVTGCTNDLTSAFLQYDWPGNIRELRNVIESIFIHKSGTTLTLDDIPEHYQDLLQKRNSTPDEKDVLIYTLQNTCGNKKKAAKILNYSRMTLYRKLAKYGLDMYTYSQV